MAGGEWHMMVGRCDVKLGGFHEGESSDPVPVMILDRLVERHFHRLIEHPTNAKMGILTHGTNEHGRATEPQRLRPGR